MILLMYNNMNQSYRDIQIRHHTEGYYPYKAKAFQSYEDYLHGRSKHHNYQQQPPKYQTLAYNTGQVPYQHYKVKEPQQLSQIKYYPVQKTIVEYVDREVKQIVPKKKVITQYKERKEVQIIPREVVVTDYYAVEHVRSYIKQVVPEMKIEHVKVPKVIKSQISVPVSRQIVYYPSNSQQTVQVLKVKARTYLQKEGVKIHEDAEYRPISQKKDHLPYQNQHKKVVSLQKHHPQHSYLRDSPSKIITKPLHQPRQYPTWKHRDNYQQNRLKQQKYTLPRKVMQHTLNNQTPSSILRSENDYTHRKVFVEDPPAYNSQNYTGYIKNSYSQYLKNLLSQQNLSKYKTNMGNSSLPKQTYPSQNYNKSKYFTKNQRSDFKSPSKYWIK